MNTLLLITGLISIAGFAWAAVGIARDLVKGSTWDTRRTLRQCQARQLFIDERAFGGRGKL